MRVWLMAALVVMALATFATCDGNNEVSTPQVPYPWELAETPQAKESLECRRAMARASRIRLEIQTWERSCNREDWPTMQSYACGRIRALELEHDQVLLDVSEYCY